MNRDEFKRFTASLHTHVRSQFDAQIEPKTLCEKVKELGGSGCAITDHGVLSSIEDYRPAFKEAGLKMIPGVELYVDGGILGRMHLVLLAKSDRGYNGICKIVTESNRTLQKGVPVINQKTLLQMVSEYRGEIYALSACMQGVLCAILLQNKGVEKVIEKLLNKQSKYISPADTRVAEVEAQVVDAALAVEEATLKRDDTKLWAEMRFAKREKSIESNRKKGMDVTAVLEELESDKRKSENAKKELDSVKEKLTNAKKVLSAVQKAKNEVEESVSNWLTVEMEIEETKKQIRSEEELLAMVNNVIIDYQNAFGKYYFFAELQYHGIPEEAECFPKLVEAAKKTGMPFVATNDVHILTNSEEDRLRRQILRSMRFSKNFEEESIGDSELYLKDNYELADSLAKILPEDVIVPAIKNIDFIFERCNVEFKTEKHYPEYEPEDGKTLKEAFYDAINEGVKRRFPNGMSKEYKMRLEYEIGIIESMGYIDYHMVEKDFLEYGRLLGYVPKDKLDDAPLSIPELKAYIKENGWKNPGHVVGPGRGSAVGSIVCYVLGITNLDPIKYDLLFERFLNPSRVSMPDIDSDFAQSIREHVVNYVKHKYGESAVCGIMTTNAQGPKGAISIAAKYYGLKTYGVALTDLGKVISKKVSSEVGVSFDTKVNVAGEPDDAGICTCYEYLCSTFKETKDAKEVLRWAKIVEGSFTAYGAHAAGIGIMKKGGNLADYIPLRYNENLKMMTTQCDMVQFEENGFLKFDFLGLITLDVITDTVRMIEERTGEVLDLLNIDLNDERVYKEIFSVGKTNSVFQFESPGMKNMLKRFKPECFEDLIILVSMFRPGPMQYLDKVIDVKNGVKKEEYLCPQLEPILSKTYSAIVYQEQVMQICQQLAGYSLGDADNVRRYMSKKKSAKLAEERETFVNGNAERGIAGCVANGISVEAANELFTQMEEFAKYAFNKSHAAAYAHNAFVTAWLKTYYPTEFFCGALNWATKKKIPGLMYEAMTCGVKVCAPDVNASKKEFSIVDDAILFGLSSVANVKDNADKIIEERTNNGGFESLKDFLTRAKLDSRVIESLIDAGALDVFSDNRLAMKGMAEEIKPLIKKKQEKVSFIESADVVLPYVEKEDAETLCKIQSDAGLKVEITESTTAAKLMVRINNAKEALESVNKSLNLLRLRDCREDKTARMKAERDLLGMYVTSHPMDYYPAASELGVSVVEELEENDDTKCYGVITDLTIKNRKSDGAEMAFFSLEDRSGSVEVCCFVKEYAKLKPLIAENAVVMLKGSCTVDVLEDESVVKKFIVKDAKVVYETLPKFVLTIPEGHSMSEFEGSTEKIFIQNYASKDGNGHPLVIYDRNTDKFHERTYRVIEDATQLPYITVLN